MAGSGGGQKGRKIGRNKRKPCQQRYTVEKRWDKNKKRKMQKLANETQRVVKYKIDNEWKEASPK